MAYTVQQVQDDLAGIGHGKTPNKFTNFLSILRRAGNNLITQIDPDEMRRYTQIVLYDDVTDYNLPMTDLNEKRIFDVRPQVNRHRSDNLSSRFSKEFDHKKWDNWFTVENNFGTKYIRISKRIRPGAATIDPMDSDTNWAASGDASNLDVDTLYSVTDGNSLKFDLAASGSSGLLTNSAITTIDLSKSESIASIFLWVYLPTASTNITGVNLRLGESATAYWSMTGSIHFGVQQQGWNLFRFDWSTASKTASPDSSKIKYARIEVTYGGTAVLGMRVDRLFTSLPRVWTIGYYSKFIFNNGGTWSDIPQDTSTTINLDTGSYNLFIYEVALAGLQQIQGKDAIADRAYFYKLLYGDNQNQRGMYAEYRKNNPSQAEKPTQSYYSNLRFRRK